MAPKHFSLNLGLSDYAITAYVTLLDNHPINGSQLSRLSGIPRARAYEILRTLTQRGFVAEAGEGMYVPLPPDELIKRLRLGYEKDLERLEEMLESPRQEARYDFIWTIRGYEAVMAKAGEMIRGAREEIYTRLFPEEGRRLDPLLTKAGSRGVAVKYVAMGTGIGGFEHQVLHPGHDTLEAMLGGRSFDVVVDRNEILGGMFIPGQEDESAINWGKNRWFVLAARDSLRHDFFHYFLHKTYQLKQDLTPAEARLYARVVRDT